MGYIKPNLVLIRSDVSHLSIIMQDAVYKDKEYALSFYFNVSIVSEDCQVEEIEYKYNPDLIVFMYHPVFNLKLKIIGVENVKIPKIGFLLVDEISPERYISINYYESLKVDAFFSTGSSYTHYYSSCREKLFFLPWFIIPEKVKDYKQQKEYTFFLSSHNQQTYPWRQKVFPVIENKYDVYRLPYPKEGDKLVYGAEFSRQINRSQFSAACGGYSNAMVLKHVEIPGSATCLVTEETDIVKKAGFQDMVNCVFADEKNIIKKIDYLKQEAIKLEDITKRGYELVHEKHTAKNRSQVFEWYTLYKSKRDNEKIVQPEPFGPLRLLPITSTLNNYEPPSTRDSLILKEADEQLFYGNHLQALSKYQLLNDQFLTYSPDFKIRLCLAYLKNNKPFEALDNILFLIKCELHYCSPEPLEWCVFLLTVILYGNKKEFCDLFEIYNYKDYLFWNLLKDIYCVIKKVYINDQFSGANICDFTSAHLFLNLNSETLKKIILNTAENSRNKNIIHKALRRNKTKYGKEIFLDDLFIIKSQTDIDAILKNGIDSLIYNISKLRAVNLYVKSIFKKR